VIRIDHPSEALLDIPIFLDIFQGDRVVVVDDAVATGGSLLSAINLIESVGGVVARNVVIIGLSNLGWEKTLAHCPLTALFRL
jgi:adenine phosphoribosyltransferase